MIMKRLNIAILFLISLFVISIHFYGTVQADEQKNYAISLNDSSSIKVSKNDIINDYIKNTGVSYEEASHLLFPSSRMRSVNTTGVDSVSYVRLANSFQDDTVSDYVPGNAGKVYFYCEVSKSGWLRGIKKIIYAGYYAGNLVFSGNFQYALPDANRIHYTLSGGLYSNAQTTVSTGGSIGIGQTGSVNIQICRTTNYVRSLYCHRATYY